MIPIVRIQAGHVGRTSGSTGAYNPRLKLSEANMNRWLAAAIQALVVGDRSIDWQFIGPDERRGGSVDLFVALHMDGSRNASARGPSCGYPVGSVESKAFAQEWKAARIKVPGALPARDDNYTAALRRYYGWQSAYSGNGIKMVLENGFVTNDAEATWARVNRKKVAMALVGVIRDQFDVVGGPPVGRAEFDSLLKEVRRIGRRTTKQALTIHRLQARITDLEG